jgi:hypothetical protein
VAITVLTKDPGFDRLVTVRFRTCTECHALKRLTAFLPIKGVWRLLRPMSSVPRYM